MSVDVTEASAEQLSTLRGQPVTLRPDEPRPAPVVVDEEPPLNVALTALGVFLAVAAAAWVGGGLFRGTLGRPAAVLGAAIGVGLIAISYRSARPGWSQYLVIPVAAVAGAVLLFSSAKGASLGDLPDLVSDAVTGGGLAQPPVPFDPGWRFVIVEVFAILGAAAASLAFGLRRINVGLFVPLPVLVAAALIQPRRGSVTSGVVAVVLVVAALAVAYGAELERDGATTKQFELRRFARAAAMLVVLTVALLALSRVPFLFPEPGRDSVTPPKRPQASALQADQVLFTVKSDQPGPWRMGVLDVYDGRAFLLPPVDRRRVRDLPPDGQVPGASAAGPSTRATFTIVGLGRHDLPALPNPRRAESNGFAMAYDARTQSLSLPERQATQGMTYTVEAPLRPEGAELAQAPPPPPAVRAFIEAPPPPSEVRDVLAEVQAANPIERLEFVRTTLQQRVVAAKEGKPVDVSPARVVEMLAGKEATPFEITAAEVLLARWAGVPARIGFGYSGGEAKGDVLEIHPRQGATWLEAHFDGYGWVPFTTVPPRVKESLSSAEKQATGGQSTASNDLTLTLYVPIKLQGVQLLYKTVRYWVLVSLPFILAFLLLWRFYPGVVKLLRRGRRQRWAARHGPRERVGVAYAELRDAAHDLTVGKPAATPLEFADTVEADDEHLEMAWLVARSLWGDLRRDLRADDADAAEEMARSVSRRLRKAQPALSRVLAVGSRASLRAPYSRDVPNLWRRPKTAAGRRTGRGWRWRRLPRVAPAGAALVLALLMMACGGDGGEAPVRGANLPDPLVPSSLGDFRFQPEPSADKAFARAGQASLVRGGRVFTVRLGDQVQGYLQAAVFKDGPDADRQEVRRGILDRLAGRFEPVRRGTQRIYVSRLRDQTYQLWFAPNGRYFQLLVARQSFADAPALFDALLAYQRGEIADGVVRVPAPPPDPRRGVEDF